MLYMGIACLLATCLDLPGIYLNENGIMAINAPLTEARIGSYSTHTASPNIIRDFARLATTALGHKLSIRNILATYTKPEVVLHAVHRSTDLLRVCRRAGCHLPRTPARPHPTGRQVARSSHGQCGPPVHARRCPG